MSREREFHELTMGKFFEIDDEGRVWRIGKMHGLKTGGAAFKRCRRRRAENRSGFYAHVVQVLEGRRLEVIAHRLVWFHFRGEIPEGLTINHADGKKQHNHPDNLELATLKEQQRHAREVLGRAKDQRGKANPMAKLTDAAVRDMRKRSARCETQESIAVRHGVTQSTVSRVVAGNGWKHLQHLQEV